MAALTFALRPLHIALFAAAISADAIAAPPQLYYVMDAAVFSADPQVENVLAESADFRLHPVRPEDSVSRQRYLGIPNLGTLRFSGDVLSAVHGEVPPLGPVRVRWTHSQPDGAQVDYAVDVPLPAYAAAHNFVQSQLLISVRPDSVLVELLEDDENGFKKFYRCLGSSFSASGACHLKISRHTLAEIPAHQLERPAATAGTPEAR